MAGIEPQPGIMEISLYVGGKSSVEGVSNIVKLSSNENPYGPSPAAQEAVRRSLHEMHRYPPTDHAALREAIAEAHGLEADRIICGVGSDEVLQFLCHAYAGAGDEVIHTEHGFAMYRILAHAVGATPVEVPERERVVCVDSILEACTERTRLVFIANPNNPTGTMIGLSEIERLAANLPERALLVLDGAYAEYVEGYDGGAKLVHARDNVVMTRTFSKLYGLGGMRVGWGYGPREIIDVLNRIRQPFNLSGVALAAAEAAVRDSAYVEKSRSENTRLRAWLAEALAEHGVPSDASTANFVLARFADAEEAAACDTYLQGQGILVRRVTGYKLPAALRITVGDEASCRRVAHCIGLFKAGAR
ncbi:histidinol-phosphate transaminase [Salipiger mucosus]|uniref:Histidinol-phosphate aminotransferase n=1 Tax=Salipiger mucosus DSM 16094 TaxID=1123237 RepID=S9S961_9RHOB|nr:histidinol-phosphate transaminase [Salipiger mucosus]EPX82804.1 Biosynthetic Aromatic amino acid aminotransferase beta [Salipiger mucosus DSM 16094]